MSHLIHRSLRQMPPAARHASGVTVFDHAGNAYLDACGGAAVSALGHGHPHVNAAMHRQIDRCAYAHTAFFTTDVAEELADLLVARAPAGIEAVHLVSSASEAMDTALKLARQYFIEGGETGRSVFIARRQSDHGSTLEALATGGGVRHVAPCYAYRNRRENQSLDDYTALLLDELETAIMAAGPERVIGFVAEPVAGASGGAIPPTPGYFKGVREICDRHGILFIADEATCGMGRTGTMFAIEQEGVAPDIITVASGLGAGYQPVAAVLAQGAIVERLRHGSGSFLHGHVYSGHPVAASAALAVLQVIERDGLLEQVQRRGATLRRMLGNVFGKHEHVGDIRGRGLLVGIELVRDRATREPFAPARRLHAAIKAEALARGLMVYPMGGTIDGQRGDHILLAPPFIVTAYELSEIVARLAEAVDAAIKASP